MSNSYTFKLTSPITRVNLPFTIQNTNKLKIKFLRFITLNDNNFIMQLLISHFNTNTYYDGNTLIKLCKVIPLPNTSHTLIIYENQFSDPDLQLHDVENNNAVSTVTIEIMIDGVYSNDINENNPVFIEILIS